jgi:hypothetical protein
MRILKGPEAVVGTFFSPDATLALQLDGKGLSRLRSIKFRK